MISCNFELYKLENYNDAHLNDQCLIDIICLIEEAYFGITGSIIVISVNVWHVDVINMQQLVRAGP